MPLDEAAIQQFIALAGHHFTHEPPAYLDCSICQSTLQNPVCCTSGAHTFCRKCLTDWMGRSARPHCPIDRDPLTPGELRKAPQALQECIDALELVCGLGCGWKGGQSQWPAHLRSDCPEVEDDDTEGRQRRSGDVPRAISDAIMQTNEAEPRQGELQAPVRDEDILPLQAPDKYVGARCDLCGEDCLGETFRCCSCPDYDICRRCWNDGQRSVHHPSHAFVRLTDRADWFAGGRPRRSQRMAAPTVHRNVTCDSCHDSEIRGVRYTCVTCDNFDLCEICVDAPDLRASNHRRDHEMVRIVKARAE